MNWELLISCNKDDDDNDDKGYDEDLNPPFGGWPK